MATTNTGYTVATVSRKLDYTQSGIKFYTSGRQYNNNSNKFLDHKSDRFFRPFLINCECFNKITIYKTASGKDRVLLIYVYRVKAHVYFSLLKMIRVLKQIPHFSQCMDTRILFIIRKVWFQKKINSVSLF